MQGHEDEAGAAEANEANEQGAPAEAPKPEPEPEVVDLRDQRIAQLEQQLQDAMGRLRAVSKAFTEQKDEMTAFRERTEAASRLARERREFEVVKAFFDPVQNLKRSIDLGITDSGAFIEGLRMVLHQFGEGLQRLGLEPIPGVGAPFDPKLHEALAVMPVADKEQDGRVTFVHVDGYMVGGKAIQAAQVVIGKHAPEAASEN